MSYTDQEIIQHTELYDFSNFHNENYLTSAGYPIHRTWLRPNLAIRMNFQNKTIDVYNADGINYKSVKFSDYLILKYS